MLTVASESLQSVLLREYPSVATVEQTAAVVVDPNVSLSASTKYVIGANRTGLLGQPSVLLSTYGDPGFAQNAVPVPLPWPSPSESAYQRTESEVSLTATDPLQLLSTAMFAQVSAAPG